MVPKHAAGIGRALVAFVLLFSVLMVGVGPNLSVRGARAAASAAVATVTLDPSTVAAGDTIKLTASGFTAGETLRLDLVTTGAVTTTYHIKNYTAGVDGGLVLQKQPIPAASLAGDYLVKVTGLSSGSEASAKLTITAVKATVTVAPTSFGPGSIIKVSGTSFLPNETVQINLTNTAGTTALALGRATTDAKGNFGPKSVRVPYGVTPGALTLTATGLRSNRQASAPVTVNVVPASLSVSPTSANPGDKIAITGTHFEPGELVTVDLVALSTSAHIATVRVTAAGSFAVASAIIPKNTPQGTVSIVATGSASHLSASAQIKVGAPSANLRITPATVVAGSAVQVSGSAFIPGETISLQISGGKLPGVTLATTIANTIGSFSIARLIIPSFIPAGAYTVTAFGQTSGRSGKVALGVTTPVSGPVLSIIDAAHVAGQPYRLSPGGLALLAGAHFPANAKVTIALVGGAASTTLLLVTADAAGSLGPIGVTIPANTPAGSYTVEALVGGKNLASVKAIVASLTPHLSLSTSTLVPGRPVTVHGSGFAPGEQIVLALNGAALLTTPTTVAANAAGAFTATFIVPANVNNGANLIIASGATSRASASVRAFASLPLATSWYFPNGDTTSGTRTQIAILNPSAAQALVKLTFLYANGPEQQQTTTVPAHSQATVDLGLLAGAGRHMATILAADRQVSAQSIITYAGGDSTSATGATGPSTLWYLAEGYTNGSFREFIHVMNPQATFATIDVRFLPFNNRPARAVRFVLQPRSKLEIDAGAYMPGQSISTIVTSDKGVVVERSMRFGSSGRGAHDKIGVSSASTIWMFAEAESSADSQTFYTILNPNQAAPAAVTATFFDRAGKPAGSRTIVVDPLHRGNIKLNDVLPVAQVATILTSNVPVVVERPLYQGPANLGLDRSGSVTFGRNGGALSWGFPGGSTANGDQTQMFLFNPGLKPATIHGIYYTEAGATVPQDYTLAPNSVSVVSANSVPGLGATAFGVVLKSTNGQVFLAEMGILNTALQHAESSGGVSQ